MTSKILFLLKFQFKTIDNIFRNSAPFHPRLIFLLPDKKRNEGPRINIVNFLFENYRTVYINMRNIYFKNSLKAKLAVTR